MNSTAKHVLLGLLPTTVLILPLTAQTTLQGLGTAVANVHVTDMSADGSAVVGTDGTDLYLWTTANPSFTLVANVAAWDADVSNGGAYISATLPDPSNSNYDTPARWTASTGTWEFLGSLGGLSGNSIGSAYDMSADGAVVVGLGWVGMSTAHAFRWDASSGLMTDLGTLGGFPSSSRADGVSADGSTVVGFDSDVVTGTWRSAVWTSAGEVLTGCLNPAYPIDGPSQGYAASSNGTYVVGESNTGIYTPSNWDEMHAFRWDAANGLVDLGTTDVDPWGWGTHNTIPCGVSDDGRTVVGIAGAGFFGQQPFIARQGSPTTFLQTYLVALGVPQASAWYFADIVGLSSDGRTICGNGYNAASVSEPFFVVLPPLAETYCTSKVNSQGCTPAIAATGIASVTSIAPFTISASNEINNQSGLMYYGFAPLSQHVAGGFKCVASPAVRTPLQNAGGSPTGTDCSGSYAIDFNAWIQSGIDPALTTGTVVYAQYWTRDPASVSTLNFSNAVRFTVFP